jgi:hypothetical protein
MCVQYYKIILIYAIENLMTYNRMHTTKVVNASQAYCTNKTNVDTVVSMLFLF